MPHRYAKTGVPYSLHVLDGCGHGAWGYDGKGGCKCPPPDMVGCYNPTMDSIALPFVAQQLNLTLGP